MHVYLREEQVNLRMEAVDAHGLVPDGSELLPMAFFAEANEQPSFRALLPLETVEVLRDALKDPVILGVLAEEPPESGEEIQAMVGLAMPIPGDLGGMEEAGADEGNEPWRESVGSSEAWRGEEGGYEDAETPRTALLAFAPLVRLARRFPDDFGEELADLLESALSGSTRSALEARVDRMLDDLG